MGRRQPGRRRRTEKTTILLATNGKITEREYLTLVQKRVHEDPAKKLSVKVQAVDGEPERVLQKLTAPAGDTSSYDEVWIVVDADGKDRRGFVDQCLRSGAKGQKIRAVVSDPCFEVWLCAHYQRIGNVATQSQAQNQYAQVHGGDPKDKRLPVDFPFDNWKDAVGWCVLSNGRVPERDTDYPPCPGTMMPVLMKRLFS